MKLKCKVIKQVFKCSNYQILGCIPIDNNDQIMLNKYGNFSIKDLMLILSEGKEYTVEIEETEFKGNKSYVLKSVPSMQIESIDSITDEMEYDILCGVTTKNLAQEIHEAYPNYIRLILEGKQEEIDLNRIKGVKAIRHNLFVQLINEQFKYYYIIEQNKQYGLDMKDCKAMCELYPTVDLVNNLLEKTPYYALISLCHRSFITTDKLLREVRPDLLESDQRTEFMMLDVLKRNEYEGSTYMNANEMAEYCNAIDHKLLKKLKPVAIDSQLIYYDDATKNISIMGTYLAEQNICDIINKKIDNPVDYHLNYEKYKGDSTDEQLQLLKYASEQSIVLLLGNSGSGKAQPVDTIIPTPIGNRKLGDIKVGDYVYDRHGKPTKVLGVYPRGMLDCYTVTLSDGRQTKCNDEHLWSYYTSPESKQLITRTLRKMLSGIFYEIKDGVLPKFYIPCLDDSLTPVQPVPISHVSTDKSQQEMVCIYVDNDEHLYVTSDYIVTHNTHSAKSLISMLEDNNLSYTLVTPTGISAKRLSESTGREASTIHRKIAPIIGRHDTISSDYLICDEFGMCGVELTNWICSSLGDYSKLVLICDDAQLASIQAGNCLVDIIKSNRVPTVKLTKIFRYGIGSLATVATDIRNGKPYLNESGEKIFENPTNNQDYKFVMIDDDPLNQVMTEYNTLLEKYSFKDIIVLTPFNKHGFGTYAINNEIQAYINPPKANEQSMSYTKDGFTIAFRVGDKVLNTVNTYNVLTPELLEYQNILNQIKDNDDGFYDNLPVPAKVDIMNGDIGYIRKIDSNNMYIQFDENMTIFTKKNIYNLLLGYAVSVHKIQGSQAKAVITLYHKMHERMLSRNLIYVGNTRSQEKLVEISDPQVINNALSVVETTNRNTWLGKMLLEIKEEGEGYNEYTETEEE